MTAVVLYSAPTDVFAKTSILIQTVFTQTGLLLFE